MKYGARSGFAFRTAAFPFSAYPPIDHPPVSHLNTDAQRRWPIHVDTFQWYTVRLVGVNLRQPQAAHLFDYPLEIALVQGVCCFPAQRTS